MAKNFYFPSDQIVSCVDCGRITAKPYWLNCVTHFESRCSECARWHTEQFNATHCIAQAHAIVRGVR